VESGKGQGELGTGREKVKKMMISAEICGRKGTGKREEESLHYRNLGF
jgi:hypothetical protein